MNQPDAGGGVADHAKLQEELHYTRPRHDTRLIKTSPPGYNLMIMSGGLLFLTTFALTLQLVRGLFRGVLFGDLWAGLIAVAVGGFLGFSVPRRVWIAIGPLARSLLRPFGLLGGYPFLFLCLFGLMLLGGARRAVTRFASGELTLAEMKKFFEKKPLEGADWEPLWNREGGKRTLPKMSYQEARQGCEDLGPDWRLPTEEDLPFLEKRILHRRLRRTRFFLADANAPGLRSFLTNRETDTLQVFPLDRALEMHALCICPECEEDEPEAP